jgi:hypothetical protein
MTSIMTPLRAMTALAKTLCVAFLCLYMTSCLHYNVSEEADDLAPVTQAYPESVDYYLHQSNVSAEYKDQSNALLNATGRLLY